YLLTVNTLKLSWKKAADFVIDDNVGTVDNDEAHHSVASLPSAHLWANGWIDFQQRDAPAYAFDIRALHLDISRLLLMPEAATDASFRLNFAGKGFSADSIRGTLYCVTQELHTPKKAFEPFTVSVRLEHIPKSYNPQYREFHLVSDLAEAHIAGVFTVQDIIASIAQTIDNTVLVVRRKYHSIRDSLRASTYEGLYIRRPEYARPLDATFVLKPRDISIARLFTGFVKVQCIGDIHGSLRGTTQDYMLRIDSSHIREFFYTDGLTQVDFADTWLEGTFHTTVQGDSLNIVAASARTYSDSVFRLNDWIFRHAHAAAEYRNDVFTCDIHSVYDDSLLVFYTRARCDMTTSNATVQLDTVWLLYRRDMEWRSVGGVTGVLNKEGLLLEHVSLQRPGAETVYMNGLIWFDHYSNALLIVESMPLQDINRLFAPERRMAVLQPLKGMLERVECRLSGTPENPDISLLVNASNVVYNGTYLGRCAISATHQDSIVRGVATVQNPLLQNDTLHTLRVVARALPLNLAFVNAPERIVPNRMIDVTFDAEQLPLGALNVFVPGITNLQGYADVHFSVKGRTLDSIRYTGHAVIPRSSFIFDATNLKYYAEVQATFLDSTVTLERATLANDPLDYERGRAFAQGRITVNGFSIARFDITAHIPQQGLFVLGLASRIPNPQLFGDVIISTGVRPIHFYGTLEEPYLRGDINILSAKINFPEIRSVRTEGKLFCFEIISKERGGRVITARDCQQHEYAQHMQQLVRPQQENMQKMSFEELAYLSAERVISIQHDTANYQHTAMQDSVLANSSAFRMMSDEQLRRVASVESVLSSQKAIDKDKAEQRSRLGFAHKIDYALDVHLRGNFSVTMDWGPFEQLVANLAQENPEQPLRYIKTPDKPYEHRLFGDLILREGSTYKYYRIFNASGKLSFNTGTMSNPRLNIQAVLRGQRTVAERGGTSEYRVHLDIGGTKQSPSLKMRYWLDNVPGVGDSTKIQNDAIMLLLFGRTQDEFALGTGLGSVTQNTSSSLASRLLTDLLQGTGIVRSADILFSSGNRSGGTFDLSQARVQVTGEISNLGVLWQLANDFGSNTANTTSFSIDIPFRSFLDQELFRNIVLQITRSAAIANSSVFLRQQREWEIKIGSRNSW
ncbi:MAG: translocation/assembly module TamB domain-containing protein, partial [Bacteroidota bacterium]|nr:translocation/assembly module TamB [Candidatus Kapabacteria bacterium]MDW8219595.1 translocation/assembly module TamB domain-containing protein [Bacteroidota bacterium]